MGIIDRLSTLIRSNINDLISRAENPQKVLEQLIVDMRNQLAKAKQQVAAAIADEKLLFLLGLRGEPLLIGNGGGRLLLGLRQLIAHVDDELLENLLRILGARDQIVDVRPDQRRQTINDPHGSLCSWQ